MLKESSRICREQVIDLEKLRSENFDALVIPGGTGAIKSLSDFAFRGKDMKVDLDVKRVINDFYSQ